MPRQLSYCSLSFACSFLASVSAAGQGWVSSGSDIKNSRFGSAESQITSGNASKLVNKWIFSTQNDVSATVSVDPSGGCVYFPDASGMLYKVDATTGALIWSHSMTDYGLPAGITSRTTPTISGSALIIGASARLGDHQALGGYIVSVSAWSGNLLWKTQVDPSPYAMVTGSPVVYNGVIYSGVSSSEERLAQPTFRGSAIALDVNTGAILWQSYMTPPGYSGNAIWSGTPAVDAKRGQIYVTTGNNYQVPKSVQHCEMANLGNPQAVLSCQDPTNYEDSIVALDMRTGVIKWGMRFSSTDAWVVQCLVPWGSACPAPAGPDYDFGSGANLFTATIDGEPTDLVGGGQKSGVYWALNADTGQVVWGKRVGPGGILGGIQWGTATDGRRIYVAVSNSTHASYTLEPSGIPWNGGSWAALDPATGSVLWQVADPGLDPTKPGTSTPAMDLAPVSVANGVVYAASMSGYMYALDAGTGASLWSYSAGGSVNSGASISNGSVYWGSGYHNFGIPPIGTASNKVFGFTLSH